MTTISRRTLLAAAACSVLVIGVGAGCSSDELADRLAWLEEQDGVASAEQVTYVDSSSGPYDQIVVHTQPDLEEDRVRDLVKRIQEGFEEDTGDFSGSLELDLDGFHGRFYTSLPSASSPRTDYDLQRALWLRADGRATSSGYQFPATGGGSGMRIVAPAGVVAAVTLAVDRAFPDDEDRTTHRTTSEDGYTFATWSASSIYSSYGSLAGAPLDAIARVQERYPGTTFRYDGLDGAAELVLSPDDLGLDDAITVAEETARLRALRAPGARPLLVGWGPARAEATELRRVFSAGPRRRLVERLAAEPTVRSVTGYLGSRSPDVVVSDARGFEAALAALEEGRFDSEVTLVRDPPTYAQQSGPEILRVGVGAPGYQLDAVRPVLDLPTVLGLSVVTYDRPRRAALLVAPSITDDDLDTSLSGLTALPPGSAVSVAVAVVPDGGTAPDPDVQRPLGSVRTGRSTRLRPDDELAADDAALATRVSDSWGRVSGAG